MALSTLHHVIDLEWLKEAYRLTRKDGAPGIDGVMAADYAENFWASWSASSPAAITRRRSGVHTYRSWMHPDHSGQRGVHALAPVKLKEPRQRQDAQEIVARTPGPWRPKTRSYMTKILLVRQGHVGMMSTGLTFGSIS